MSETKIHRDKEPGLGGTPGIPACGFTRPKPYTIVTTTDPSLVTCVRAGCDGRPTAARPAQRMVTVDIPRDELAALLDAWPTNWPETYGVRDRLRAAVGAQR